MLRRRTLFATPFVVVLGCSHPADHTSSPQTKRDDAAQAQDEGSDHVDVKDPGPGVTAENPGTGGCVPGAGHTCNPPAPAHDKIIVDATVKKQERDQGGVVFSAYLDKSAEVTTRFTGVFVDDKGPIENSDFVIQNTHGRELLCLLKGRDELPSKKVRIYEPGAR